MYNIAHITVLWSFHLLNTYSCKDVCLGLMLIPLQDCRHHRFTTHLYHPNLHLTDQYLLRLAIHRPCRPIPQFYLF